MARPLNVSRLRPPAPLLLGTAALLLFTVALGQMGLWDIDEVKYAAVAREIVRRGDPLTLYWNGEPWFDKPPLYMWLVAATGRLVGFTEWSVRLWVAVFGAVGVVATYLLGRLLYGVRTGVLAGLILMTTLEYFIVSRLAVLDAPLVAFMLLSLYMVLVAGEATGPAKRRAYRWAFLWAALATLTKGPIGLLLPGLVIAVWWLLRGEGRRVRELPWEGMILFVVIGLGWYAVEAARHGLPFLRQMVGFHMVQRFFGVVDNQPGPWYYYVPVLLGGGLPWSAFLPSAVVFLARGAGRDRAALLLLLWIGLIFAFYSAAGTKLPNYILPVFPLAAIGVSRLWTAALDGEDPRARRLARGGIVALPLIMLLVAVGLVVAARPVYAVALQRLRTSLLLVAVAGAAGAVIGLALFVGGRPAPALVALILGTVLAYGIVILLVQPGVEALRPMKPLALLLRAQASPGDHVVAVEKTLPPSIVYYAETPVALALTAEELRRELCASRRGFVVASRGLYDRWVQPTFAAYLAPLAEKGGIILLKQTGPVPCASP